MTDYYSLIARAIDPNASGERRRAVYERARTALITQLRSIEPPLSESEITRARLSLEEAVRKVETEAVHRARDARAGEVRRINFQGSTQAADAQAAGGSPSSRPRLPASSRIERPQRLSRADGPRPGAIAEPHLTAARERSGPGSPRRAADSDPGPAPRAGRGARVSYAGAPPELGPMEADIDGGFEPPYSYDAPLPEPERYAPASRLRTASYPEHDEAKKKRDSMFPFKSAIAGGIVLILVGAGLLWGKPVLTIVSGLFNRPSSTVDAPQEAAAPAVKPKIMDRVGQPASQEAEPVAQRVVLYDEDPSDPKGKQYVGTVVWRTEPITASNNQPPDIAVHADIDIPERNFKMTMSIRRNTDTSLPASHTAELTFILPQDFSGGGVANVPGILMKSSEQARGTPLAGLAVKVTDGFFLVGLSNVDTDRSRNMQLLKERSWFDVPLVYANQRRAIIAIEKGPSGERAFNDAFGSWGE